MSTTNIVHIVHYSWGGLVLIWLASAARTKPSLRTTGVWSRLMSVTTMLFGFILVISGSFPNWLAAEPLAPYAGLRWSGATLTLLGCSFAVWARMALGANWSGRPTVKSGHQLIVGGPYAFARHPIYTGLLVAAIGTTFADLQWPRVLGVAIIAGVMLFKIRQEESLMMDTFPDTYPRYRQNVKALIPGLF